MRLAAALDSATGRSHELDRAADAPDPERLVRRRRIRGDRDGRGRDPPLFRTGPRRLPDRERGRLGLRPATARISARIWATAVASRASGCAAPSMAGRSTSRGPVARSRTRSGFPRTPGRSVGRPSSASASSSSGAIRAAPRPGSSFAEVPEAASPDWSTHQRFDWTIGAHGQELGENGVDPAHFRFVHGTLNVPNMEAKEDGPRTAPPISPSRCARRAAT